MIFLRDIAPDDQEKILQWRNHLEVRKFMYTDHEITPEEHRAWFSRILHDSSCKYWVIVCDGEEVGLAYIFNIDNRNRRCYWGFYVIGSNVRGRGVGSFAEFFVLRFVFEDLRLQKLCGEVLEFNQAVLNMHRKFGFVQEGLLRKHVLKGDSFVNVVCISILRDEWDATKNEIELRLKAKGIL